MRHIIKALVAGISLLGCTFWVQVCQAENVGLQSPMSNDVLSSLEVGSAISNDDLRQQTGRQDTVNDQLIQLNNMRVNAAVNGNFLTSTATGNNSLNQDAFSNASGIATVIQNTGNQVIIQNPLIMNLYMN